MAVILALPRLYDAVVARMDADAAAAGDDPVPQDFGWRAPDRRRGTHRIAWVPGEDQSGALGDLAAARHPGQNPRPLATLTELFTVYLEAVDKDEPENERKQYQATRELFDAWYRAVYLAAHGTFAIRSANWVIETKVRRRGACIRVVGSTEAMVPDAPLDTAPVDTEAEIAVEELGVTETMTTETSP